MKHTDHQDYRQTPLHDLHVELDGRMVPFAGYEMPVQYPLGIIKEHLHTRQAAGLFDVSHMGQLRLTGTNVAEKLEKLIPADIGSLGINQQVYGLFLNDRGGILDDLIVCRWGAEDFFLVVNAACKERDVAHLKRQLDGIDIEVLDDRALLALQGPQAVTVLSRLSPCVTELVFMTGMTTNILGVSCYVTRSGYTGEDGFEISLPAHQAENVARHLLASLEVKPVGLGARDTLRLEAGLCLYGHDMDESATPVEAAIAWSIGKSRRAEGAKAGGFPGSEDIFSQIQDGAARKRIGFVVDSRAPVREGAKLLNARDEVVGQVTSGGFAPTLKSPIGMAYVDTNLAKPGTSLFASVRGRQVPISVVKMPFVPQRYYRG